MSRNAPAARIKIKIKDELLLVDDSDGTTVSPRGALTDAPALAGPDSDAATVAVGVEADSCVGLSVAESPLPKMKVVAESSKGSVCAEEASATEMGML